MSIKSREQMSKQNEEKSEWIIEFGKITTSFLERDQAGHAPRDGSRIRRRFRGIRAQMRDR